MYRYHQKITALTRFYNRLCYATWQEHRLAGWSVSKVHLDTQDSHADFRSMKRGLSRGINRRVIKQSQHLLSSPRPVSLLPAAAAVRYVLQADCTTKTEYLSPEWCLPQRDLMGILGTAPFHRSALPRSISDGPLRTWLA